VPVGEMTSLESRVRDVAAVATGVSVAGSVAHGATDSADAVFRVECSSVGEQAQQRRKKNRMLGVIPEGILGHRHAGAVLTGPEGERQ